MNSPAMTLLVYTFEVYGSNDSLLPKIYEVDAVGMGESKSEFLTPCSITCFLKASQSYLSCLGLTFHKSNWNFPSDKGEPLKVEYGPSSFAISMDVSIEAW